MKSRLNKFAKWLYEKTKPKHGTEYVGSDADLLDGISPPNTSKNLIQMPPFHSVQSFIEGVAFSVIPLLEFCVLSLILLFIGLEIYIAGFKDNVVEQRNIVGFLKLINSNWIGVLLVFLVLASRTIIKKIQDIVSISKDGANFQAKSGDAS
jgi:hypothetical protein